jgi:FkbM family methyltransferase
LLGAVIDSEPVQHVVQTVRAARAVRERSRFTASQLLTSRTATYELRSSGLTIALRHRTRDVDIFKEIFGTGYAYNSYDTPPEVEAIMNAASAPVVLDVGGNIGLFGVYVLGRWPQARVTSFEPDPTNLPLIRRTIAANRLEDRWRLQPVAVSNAAGELPFVSGLFAESQLAGVERADDRPPESARLESGHVVNVPVVDLFAQDHRAELMKMDIEGGEWPILTDPRLARLGARAIVLEWHADGAPERDAHAAALRALAAAGYTEVHQIEDLGHRGVFWAWRP